MNNTTIYKVGDYIHIDEMIDQGGDRYKDAEGRIEHIDSIGQLHGTWGGLAIIPGVDKFHTIAPPKTLEERYLCPNCLTSQCLDFDRKSECPNYNKYLGAKAERAKMEEE